MTTTYDTLPNDVRILREGDLVDLKDVDLSLANRDCWEFEYAEVESVSTHDNPSGGWLDGQLRTIDGSPNGYAIIYVTNGVAPALVIDRRNQ